MMTHYQVQKATDGKFYITVFNNWESGSFSSQILPEAHKTLEDAQEWARIHALPILEAQGVYFNG